MRCRVSRVSRCVERALSFIAMAKKTYAELLKDPRWQKRRLEILTRDKWTCRACDDTKETLHVHHLRYDYDIEPWEANDDDLVTLCETCHQGVHYIDKCNVVGLETLILVVRLLDHIEMESIDKYFRERDKLKIESTEAKDDRF